MSIESARLGMIAALLLSIAVVSASARAQTCPDADLLGSALTSSICWSCMLPIRLMGESMSGSTPSGAVSSPFCTCVDTAGVPEPGFSVGMWRPARLIEVVGQAYCSPVLGGVNLIDSASLIGGYQSRENDISDTSFYNYHYYAFPLDAMMGMFVFAACNQDGYVDMDLMYMSELIPTWSDNELSFFMFAESIVFANPIAVAACSVDCGMATAGNPSDSMFWCAGCAGQMYPISGFKSAAASRPTTSELISARALASMHRLGLARKTMGSDAQCNAPFYPTLPKRQYKMSHVYPVPEADGNCCHSIGASSFTWGEHRTIPATGEDMVKLVWRWTDCCVR